MQSSRIIDELFLGEPVTDAATFEQRLEQGRAGMVELAEV